MILFLASLSSLMLLRYVSCFRSANWLSIAHLDDWERLPPSGLRGAGIAEAFCSLARHCVTWGTAVATCRSKQKGAEEAAGAGYPPWSLLSRLLTDLWAD